jgi:hypothetical protein
MSNQTPNLGSGTPDVPNIAIAQVTEAGREWALTVALQKTEWHALNGVTTRLLTLKDKQSGRTFVAAVWAIPTENLTADNDKFTFFVSGTDVDDIVAQIGSVPLKEGV